MAWTPNYNDSPYEGLHLKYKGSYIYRADYVELCDYVCVKYFDNCFVT